MRMLPIAFLLLLPACSKDPEGCASDLDCKGDRVCDAATRQCIEPDRCVTDADCKGSRVCDAALRLCVEPSPDLRTGPPDGATDDLARPSARCFGVTAGPVYRIVTNAIKLPSGGMPYSIDIDGDGRPDNQLRAVFSVIQAAGLDLSMAMTKALANGEGLWLLEVQAADLMDGCAKVSLYRAQQGTKPRFDGTDTFMRTGDPAAVLYGPIVAGRFDAIQPRDLLPDQAQKFSISLPLAFVAPGLIPLPTWGIHVQGSIAGGRLLGAELHGAARQREITDVVIPAIARGVTEQINREPTSSTSQTLINLFETMDNPASKAKCDANPMDC